MSGKGNTFNLSIVFDEGRAIGTIVCYSDNEIDVAKIRQVVGNAVNSALTNGFGFTPKRVINSACAAIQNNCLGVQAVVVPTDACIMIKPIMLRRPNEPDADTK